MSEVCSQTLGTTLSIQPHGALSRLGKTSYPLLCVDEDIKSQKRPKLSNGSRASPSLLPHFPRVVESQGLPFGHIFQGLDIRNGCPQNAPWLARTLNNPRAACFGPSALNSPMPAAAKAGMETMESLSLDYKQQDHCQQSRQAPENGRGSRVTGLYAELVKELELQMSELRKLLASQEETAALQERRIRELERENQQLKSQLQNLEEQNDLLSRGHGGVATPAKMVLGIRNNCVDITENNIQFLKSLVGLLESNAALQVNGLQPLSSPGEQRCTPADIPQTSPVWRTRARVSSSLPPWMNIEDSSASPGMLSDTTCLWEENIQDTLPDGTPVWASPVEENGRPKLELIPNSSVYITHHQLDDLSQISTDKPKLMTRRLLDYFFSRETLARSSATGQRTAHNNTTMEKPIRLPVAVVNVIKEYVTKVCGRGCNFHAVINSKCGTSRRAVKKMIIKMD
uniref:BEN domain-containing protein n=1 Tax=Sphenodon punctatus TaxID=8508 RepID=A0A8D0HNC0_SPHPU